MENGVVYTKGQPQPYQNYTSTEDFYENLDVAGQINITNTTLDKWGNPADSSYDLGKDGFFSNLSVAIGMFNKSYYQVFNETVILELKSKGF